MKPDPYDLLDALLASVTSYETRYVRIGDLARFRFAPGVDGQRLMRQIYELAERHGGRFMSGGPIHEHQLGGYEFFVRISFPSASIENRRGSHVLVGRGSRELRA